MVARVRRELHPKDLILDDQKANELRVYDAKRYSAAKEIVAGQICASRT